MKLFCAVLLLVCAARGQVLAKVKSRNNKAAEGGKGGAITVAPAKKSAQPSERRLIEADKLKTLLEDAAKEYLWTVGDPAENVIVVSEKVGEADVAIFKATLTEVEVTGSTEKKQYLTLENRPKDAEDAQFQRYKHAHVLFRRKVSAKDTAMLGPFIKHCTGHFKAIYDKLRSTGAALGLLEVVKQVVAELKMPGVAVEQIMAESLHVLFNVKDALGNVRYHGSIYRISDDYSGLALWSNDEFIQVYSGQGSEVNFRARIAYILRMKLSQPSTFLKVAQIKDKVLAQIRGRCAVDPPGLRSTSIRENYFATDLVAATPAGVNQNLNSCIYTSSKLLILQYQAGKIQYFHFLIDLKEVQTEDIMLPNAIVFDNLLAKSLNKNQNTVMFIRKSRLASKKEVTADENKIKAALVAAIGGAAQEAQIPDDLKAAVEVEDRKWLKRWTFRNGIQADLFQNNEDFVIEVTRPDPRTKAMTTTQIAIPVFNGYDHVGLVQSQVAEFVAGL